MKLLALISKSRKSFQLRGSRRDARYGKAAVTANFLLTFIPACDNI
jgi:hypothetical protein